MKIGTTLKEFTENYNGIIKSKWRLLEEVDCLPSDREIKTDIAQKILNIFKHARKELAEECRPLADVIFLYTKGLSDQRVQLLAGSPSETPFVIGEWQLVYSKLQPEAVKEVCLTGSYNSGTPFKEVLRSVAQTIMVNANADTVIEIWEKLPESVKREPENMVCPYCRRRGTSYVSSCDRVYFVRCEECDHGGPEEKCDYDAVDSFMKRFHKEYLKARKKERFDILAQKQLEIISDALDAIKELQTSRVCYCDEETIKKIKDNILQKTNELL